MPVPKTAVHEQNHAILGQDYIGLARQQTVVKPEAVPHRMESGSHKHLRCRVLGLYTRHVPTAALLVDPIHS